MTADEAAPVTGDRAVAKGCVASEQQSGPLPAAEVTELTTVLSKSLRALGKAGFPVQASRLGGKAWWILNQTNAREAERINGVMHFLARLPEEETDTRTRKDGS